MPLITKEQISNFLNRLFHVGVILSLFLGISGLSPARVFGAANLTETPSNDSLHIDGQKLSQSGWFSIIWGDGLDGKSQTLYTLTDDTGQTTLLSLDETLAQSSGGILSFDRRVVSVQGIWTTLLPSSDASARLKVTSISLAPLQEVDRLDPVPSATLSGSQPWISIMCKFSDYADEPENLAFFQGMYAGVKPGLDHYWRELSYDKINVAGSNASGWFVLPHPEAYYNPSDTSGGTNRNLLAEECIHVANASVNFADYSGINMMFNTDYDNGWAYGGSMYMTLDGETKVWSITWEPPWAYEDIAVIAHEMGHGFGLPHSSGNYGETYDNAWDVMSDDRFNCAAGTDPVYGCMAQHTISYHKDKLGWIPTGQKFIAGQNSLTTITLEQLALPQTGNYKMAQIPIIESNSHFYTVETRRLTGYDVKLPGNAVVIHEVDKSRSRPAYVIDADGNGDTGDAGAMWTVGETFTDPANAIYVYISTATATGFQVTINTLPFATISGYVRMGSGSGIGGVVMNGLPHNPTTDVNGYYSDVVSMGWSGTVTPIRTVYDFNPSNIVYTNVTSDQANQNYIASNNYTGIYYVKPVGSGTQNCISWDNACSLQDALTSASSGGEIWVAAGTHKPTTVDDRSSTFHLLEGVALYGGFTGNETSRTQRNPTANVTILSGEIGAVTTNIDNSYHVVTGVIGATLDGFTFTAGNANGNNPNDRGGGAYNESGSPSFTNATFTSNSAKFGGGMYNSSGTSPLVSNVTFSSNLANQGGAIYNSTSSPTLTNVTFTGNLANFGGAIYNSTSSPTLTNVTFSGNSATTHYGGAIYNSTSNPTLTNVTFTGNSANYGGGMFIDSSSLPQIRNTILWGNTASSAGAQIYGSSNLSYSVVQGGYPGTNIITTNPFLGTLGNYGGSTQTIPLLPGSSAFNAGNDATCAATDQRGIPRPQGMHCDIGAFEVLAETTPPETMIINKPASLDNDTTPTFTFSGDDGTGSGVASFMCRMDGGSYTGCTSPFTSNVLADGEHTFYVYAMDNFGNADASPAFHTWTLDSLAPNIVSILLASPNPTKASSVNFTVTFSEDIEGVYAEDFTLTKTGTISGESVASISGGPDIYTVTVLREIGIGYLRLDVPASATISSMTGHSLARLPYTGGEFYSFGFFMYLPIINR
jgi:M6 family metalloprotease-like protein